MKHTKTLILVVFPVLSFKLHAADWSYAAQIATIVEKQGDAAAADKTVNAARERSNANRWNYLPTASVDAKRYLVKSRVPDMDSYRQTTTTAAVNLNVFRFGADQAAIDRSSFSYDASVGKGLLAHLDSEAKAAQMIHEAIADSMEADVYKRRLGTQSQVISASEARFRKGILSEQELTKLKLEASNLQLAMNAAERKAQRAVSLIVSFGATLPTPLSWPISGKTNTPVSTASVREWSAKLTQEPLEVRTLESAAKAAEAYVREARGTMLPTIDATAAWNRSFIDGAPTQTDQQLYYLTLTVPLFSRFSDWGEYRARAEEAGATSATLESTRIKTAHDFNHEKILLRALADEAAERDKNIAAADKLFQDNLKRFERGLISVNDLSLDEFRLREAELTAIRTWQSFHDELFQLAKISGTSALSVVTSR